jgi:hypothetical protein
MSYFPNILGGGVSGDTEITASYLDLSISLIYAGKQYDETRSTYFSFYGVYDTNN